MKTLAIAVIAWLAAPALAEEDRCASVVTRDDSYRAYQAILSETKAWKGKAGFPEIVERFNRVSRAVKIRLGQSEELLSEAEFAAAYGYREGAAKPWQGLCELFAGELSALRLGLARASQLRDATKKELDRKVDVSEYLPGAMGKEKLRQRELVYIYLGDGAAARTERQAAQSEEIGETAERLLPEITAKELPLQGLNLEGLIEAAPMAVGPVQAELVLQPQPRRVRVAPTRVDVNEPAPIRLSALESDSGRLQQSAVTGIAFQWRKQGPSRAGSDYLVLDQDGNPRASFVARGDTLQSVSWNGREVLNSNGRDLRMLAGGLVQSYIPGSPEGNGCWDLVRGAMLGASCPAPARCDSRGLAVKRAWGTEFTAPGWNVIEAKSDYWLGASLKIVNGKMHVSGGDYSELGVDGGSIVELAIGERVRRFCAVKYVSLPRDFRSGPLVGKLNDAVEAKVKAGALREVSRVDTTGCAVTPATGR